MIRFTVAKEKNTIQVAVSGHAPGFVTGSFNAVCGMVSVLTQAALWGCFNYGTDTQVIVAEPGRLIFVTRRTPEAKAVVGSMAEGLRQIKEQFPQCFDEAGGESE